MNNALVVGLAMVVVGALLVIGGVWRIMKMPGKDKSGAATVLIGIAVVMIGIGVCIGGWLR